MVAIVRRNTMLRNRNSVTWVVKVNGVTTDIVNIRDIADYKVKLFNDTKQAGP